MFFLSPEIDFFFGNRQKSSARAGQEKKKCFFCNARPKSNARAHLKRRKKHSGPIYTCDILQLRPNREGLQS